MSKLTLNTRVVSDLDRYSNCDFNCSVCNYNEHIRNNKITYMLENKDLLDKPFFALQNKILIEPKQYNGKLNLSNKSITALFNKTIIYQNIRELNISNNNIKQIPYIHTLEILNCSDCNIRELHDSTILPNITELYCNNNLLTIIPHYINLKKLECSSNLIKHIPAFKKLTYLICNDNPITDINIQSLTYLEAYGCPILVLYKIPSLHKRTSVIINGEMKILITKQEKLNTNNILINWNNNTCSKEIKNRLKSNSLLCTVVDFLFK